MTAHLFPFTDPVQLTQSPPMEIVSGDGARVTDRQGKTYLDAVAGLWCASLGFTPARLQQAAQEQIGRLGYYHSFMGRTSSPTLQLAERLVARLPDGLEHVFFGTSGSEAVEAAVKFARYVQASRGKPGKVRIIAREGAYHGSGHISAALTGMAYCHDGFHLPQAEVLRTGRAHFYGDGLPGETETAFVARRAAELE
ncbi:MAG: aminotransferase class III-fold pyridoxal phosphate-dependent enzyme, partial [Rhodospirillaceae bacterium]